MQQSALRSVNAAMAAASRFRIPGYDRDDLRQEAALAALSGLARTYDGSITPDAFCYMAGRRRLISLLRRARTEIPLDAVPEPAARPAGEPVGLLSLPSGLARPLVMHLAGFSYSEIAEREGCSRKAVDSRLWRARRALREAA